MEKFLLRAEKFRQLVKKKNFKMAKQIYDRTVSEAVRNGLEEKYMVELFGQRGNRGVIIKVGEFPEEMVQKCYYEIGVKKAKK